jgi:putative membrane protein
MFSDVTVADFPAWEPHPEVWLLVASVLALGIYVDRVIGPKVPVSVRGDGPAISRRQRAWFLVGVATLWIASDWPMHDVAEQYLYAIHMVQHLVLTLVMPPMFWLAMPSWLAELAVPEGSRVWAVLRRVARPIPAAVIFNALTIATHWTVVVNTSVEVGPVHYVVHLVIVTSAFLMWIPVVGPWRQLRISPVAQCIYLFTMSIIPTVPGAWLTMAEYAVYRVYDHGPRLWGITVVEDQQYAGLFMKVGGGAYLWTLIVTIFFRWALALERTEARARIVTVEDGLTYQALEAEFDRIGPPAADPEPHPRSV